MGQGLNTKEYKMITRLIWPKFNNGSVDAFWVECTDYEMTKYVFPFTKDEFFEINVKRNRGANKLPEWKTKSDICNFILVTQDAKIIESHPWVMPFSGLWNGNSPFREIKEASFTDLNDLKNIKIEYV